MNQYFSLSDKLYDVTEKYPELIEFLAEQGFEMLRNEAMRKTMGQSISLGNALKSRQMDPEMTEAQMVAKIEESGKPEEEIRMEGVLPCPVRLQILEKLNSWIEGQEQKVTYDLQAASMGLDGLREKIEAAESAENLADVYLSAGFSLFFDEQVMGEYLEDGVFADLSGFERLNETFDNDEICLRDPKGRYTIIGVVPAIFMVNTAILGDRPFPETWEDLLKPEFENSLAVPMQDADLANALLLTIYSKFGENGVRALGRNVQKSMHPAQMVKEGARPKQNETPVVTVMPYFFTWMAKEGSPMKAVWPKDGAIISPIFLATKAASKEKIKELREFLFSSELSRILSADGKFPSTHPEAENGLTPEQKFMWPGWEFIYSHDISELLKCLETVFESSAE